MDKIIDNSGKFYFTITDNYILNSAGLTALEQIVYVHLKKYSSQNNICFPGINELVKVMSLSSNTIRKILNSLKNKGFIDIKHRFNNSNEYTLLTYPGFMERAKESCSGSEPETGIGKVLLTYQKNINPIFGSMERDKLITWFQAFEENEEILIKAIELAVENGVRKIKYIETILLDWHKGGIKSLQQCEDYQKRWKENRNGIGDVGKNQGTDKWKKYGFSGVDADKTM